MTEPNENSDTIDVGTTLNAKYRYQLVRRLHQRTDVRFRGMGRGG